MKILLCITIFSLIALSIAAPPKWEGLNSGNAESDHLSGSGEELNNAVELKEEEAIDAKPFPANEANEANAADPEPAEADVLETLAREKKRHRNRQVREANEADPEPAEPDVQETKKRKDRKKNRHNH